MRGEIPKIVLEIGDTIVEMTLPEENRQIFASKYLTVIPDKETLRNLVRKQLGSNP